MSECTRTDSCAAVVFGNVGSIIAFQVGTDDAESLAEQLSKHPGQLHSQDLTNLPRYTAYARLLIDGMPSNPFSMQTLSPPPITEDRYAIVADRSRREHARPLTRGSMKPQHVGVGASV